MKTLVVNMPDATSGAVFLKNQKDPKLRGLQKQFELKRGLQEYSPRTSAPPVIKELDKNKFQTVATRNFNAQVMVDSIYDDTDQFRNQAESPKQANAVPETSFLNKVQPNGRKMKMAKITGALTKVKRDKMLSPVQRQSQLHTVSVSVDLPKENSLTSNSVVIAGQSLGGDPSLFSPDTDVKTSAPFVK